MVTVLLVAVLVTAPLSFLLGVWYRETVIPALVDRGRTKLAVMIPTLTSLALLLAAASVTQ